MKVHILNQQTSLINQFIAEIRDVNIQNDRMRFRKNLERIGEMMACEIAKHLEWKESNVTTPLGNAKVPVLASQPVLATILRAGLPVHQGLLNYFDKAENAFISAYRKHSDNGTFDIHIEYLSSPTLNNKTIILSDPMLASGASMVLGYQALLKKGNPKHVHIVSVLGSAEGVEYVKNNLPANTTLWLAAVDPELNSHKYIVPGLGDAGDLAFGEKE
jgi:uracil phosphoribosyltransferase